MCNCELNKELFAFETGSHVAGCPSRADPPTSVFSCMGITSVYIMPCSPRNLVCVCLCARVYMWRPDLRVFLRSCVPLLIDIHVLTELARLAGQ